VFQLDFNVFPEGLEGLSLIFAIRLRLGFCLDDAVFLRYDPRNDTIILLARIQEAEVVLLEIYLAVLGYDGDDGI